MPFIEATVTTAPSLLESLGYAESLPAARLLSEAPGLEGSQFSAQLIERLGNDTNLGRREAITWLKFYLLGEYSEEVISESAALVEVLALEAHVPATEGATAKLEVSSGTGDSVSFEVSVLGSGGGRAQLLKFKSANVTRVSGCTRISYSAMGVLQLVEMVNGPDAGRRFVRLKELGNQIAQTETSDIRSPHCEEGAKGAGFGRRVFDLRRGYVEEQTEELSIAIEDEWKVEAGVTFPGFNVGTKMTSKVKRDRAIATTYSLPPGMSYEAYRDGSSPYWQWTRLVWKGQPADTGSAVAPLLRS